MLTQFTEVLNNMAALALIDNPPQGEEGECVKQLEDGVARLVNRHDNQFVVSQTPTGENADNRIYGNSVKYLPLPLTPTPPTPLHTTHTTHTTLTTHTTHTTHTTPHSLL